MIDCQSKDMNVVIAKLAKTLSPCAKYRRNDIARHWIFDESNWIAEEVYEGDPKQLIGVKLVSPEFDRVETARIEYALAMLIGQKPLLDDCEQTDEQCWGDAYPDKQYDCGYETTYRIRNNTLKITVNQKGGSRGRKSIAVARFRKYGAISWKTLYELKGKRIRSRDEIQYRLKSDGYGPANSELFHHDEQELFRMAMGVLYN